MTATEPLRGHLKRLRPWFFIYVAIVAVVGIVAGIIWNRRVALPNYVIGDDYRGRIAESDLAQVIATDVHLSVIAMIAGAILGCLAWLLFSRLQPAVTLIAALGGLVAGILARLVGEFIGPRSFADRIAQADKGDLVRLDFSAHTWVPLALWVGMAVLPVLIGSVFVHDKWTSHVPQAGPGEENPTPPVS